MEHDFKELYKEYNRLPPGDRSVDIAGKEVGSLQVLYRTDNYIQPNGSSKTMWLCYCTCGKYKPIMYSNLSTNKVKSCGSCSMEFEERFCLSDIEGVKLPSAKGFGNTRHGQNHSLLFKAWSGMLHRCYNPNNTGSKYYADKGIKVCQEWLNYSNFSKDNIGRFKDGLTLDRIDTEKGYCLENTRWIPLGDQSANTGPKHWGKVKYKGVCWCSKREVYRANCYYNKKYHHVGHFSCPVEAACAYDDFVFARKGDMAWLNRNNFPEVKEYKDSTNDQQ